MSVKVYAPHGNFEFPGADQFKWVPGEDLEELLT